MTKYLPIRRFGALVLALAIAVTTAAAIGTAGASASNYNVGHWADHYTVEYKLERYWQTSDGRDIIKAECQPWYNYGNFHWSYGTAYGAAWKCKEFDTIGRRFWVHVRVYRNGGLHGMTQYRCSARNSLYYCP